MSEDCCPICLDAIDYRKARIHKTECNHIFHADCITNIREFKCPCCRTHIQPELKRKIKILKEDIRDNNWFVKNQPHVYRKIIKTHDDRIAVLERELRNAKETRNSLAKQQKDSMAYVKQRLIDDKNALYEYSVTLESELLELKQWKHFDRTNKKENVEIKRSNVKKKAGRPRKTPVVNIVVEDEPQNEIIAAEGEAEEEKVESEEEVIIIRRNNNNLVSAN